VVAKANHGDLKRESVQIVPNPSCKMELENVSSCNAGQKLVLGVVIPSTKRTTRGREKKSSHFD
jgi:hypothetical protein